MTSSMAAALTQQSQGEQHRFGPIAQACSKFVVSPSWSCIITLVKSMQMRQRCGSNAEMAALQQQIRLGEDDNAMEVSMEKSIENPANTAWLRAQPDARGAEAKDDEPLTPATATSNVATAGQLAACMVSSTQQPYTMQDFADGRPGRCTDSFHGLHVMLQTVGQSSAQSLSATSYHSPFNGLQADTGHGADQCQATGVRCHCSDHLQHGPPAPPAWAVRSPACPHHAEQ